MLSRWVKYWYRGSHAPVLTVRALSLQPCLVIALRSTTIFFSIMFKKTAFERIFSLATLSIVRHGRKSFPQAPMLCVDAKNLPLSYFIHPGRSNERLSKPYDVRHVHLAALLSKSRFQTQFWVVVSTNVIVTIVRSFWSNVALNQTNIRNYCERNFFYFDNNSFVPKERQKCHMTCTSGIQMKLPFQYQTFHFCKNWYRSYISLVYSLCTQYVSHYMSKTILSTIMACISKAYRSPGGRSWQYVK